MEPHLVDWLNNVDTQILLALNGLERLPHLATRIINGLADNPMARGLPIFVPFIWFWSSASFHERNRMLTGLIATCFAVMASVEMQHLLHTHIRPLIDGSLHITVLDDELKRGWDRPWSFPSDTSTLYFAVATIVYSKNRTLGAISYAWAFVTVGVLRVAIGFHYPTDIVAGIALGVGTVIAFDRFVNLDHLIEHVTKRWSPVVVDAAVAVFLMDAYSLFPGTQGVLSLVSSLVHSG